MRFKLLTINVSEEFSPFKNFKTTTSAHKLVIQLKRRRKKKTNMRTLSKLDCYLQGFVVKTENGTSCLNS